MKRKKLHYDTSKNALLRIATPEDKDAIIKIWRLNDKWLGRPFVGAINEAIGKREVYISTLQDVVTGFVHFHARRDGWHTIYEIAVHPDYAGMGHGRLLLWSVPAPLRLKVTADNVTAIKFYESLHMVKVKEEIARTGRALLVYELRVLFIQCAGNNRRFPDVCRAAGIPYGSRHDDQIIAQPYMLDINWEKYDWSEYLSIVKTHRPIMAMVADYMRPEDKGLMLSQVQDLREAGVLRIMVCPKFDGAVKDIPLDCMVAVSIPSVYAGFLPNPEELRGRRLHFLGGSPNKQRDYLMKYRGHGAIVSSMDGNSAERAANTGSQWKNGQWERPHLSRQEKVDKYALQTMSQQNIARMMQYIADDNQAHRQLPLF